MRTKIASRISAGVVFGSICPFSQLCRTAALSVHFAKNADLGLYMSIELARAQLERGAALHRANQFGLAQSHYERAVKLDPKNADAWHLLGLAAFQLGVFAKAVKHLSKAVQVRPEFAEAWNNLGIALKSKTIQAQAASASPAAVQGEFDAAQAAFTEAMTLRTNYVEAAHNLAILLEARGDYADAQSAYRTALSWRPQAVDSLTNLGNLLRKQGQCDAALALLAKADALAVNATTALNLALVKLDLADYKGAMHDAQRALKLEPELLDARASYGTAARLSGDLAAALPALRQVAAQTLAARLPSASDALLELAIAENAGGDYAKAGALMVDARKRAPKNERLRWNAAFLLPALMQTTDATAQALQHFEAALVEFEARVDWHKIPAETLLEAVLSTSTFDLAYLPGDTLVLQKRFAQLISEIVYAHIRPRLEIKVLEACLEGSAPRKHRIGVVSSYLREHTVMRYFAGFIKALCAHNDCEVWIWYTGAELDAQSIELKDAAHGFKHVQSGVQGTIADILAVDLDVMIYPDLAMDSQQQVFAAWRLARMQMALYGHPITTGLRQMDVYFSAAAIEPNQAQHDYSETLVLLPELGAALNAPNFVAAAWTTDANRNASAQLLCVQNLAKLTPEFDLALAEILAKSSATITFIDRQPVLSAHYLSRLRVVLSAHGVAFERVKLNSACAYGEFMQQLADADLVLDSPWFSGGASSIDTLSAGTPILSWESRFARGRQTSGMLHLIGLPKLVAANTTEFVAKALAIICDQEYTTSLRQQIKQNSHRLFGKAATQQFVVEVLALANAARKQSAAP